MTQRFLCIAVLLCASCSSGGSSGGALPDGGGGSGNGGSGGAGGSGQAEPGHVSLTVTSSSLGQVNRTFDGPPEADTGDQVSCLYLTNLPDGPTLMIRASDNSTVNYDLQLYLVGPNLGQQSFSGSFQTPNAPYIVYVRPQDDYEYWFFQDFASNVVSTCSTTFTQFDQTFLSLDTSCQGLVASEASADFGGDFSAPQPHASLDVHVSCPLVVGN